MLRAEDRVRRTGSRAAELLGRNRPNTRGQSRVLEDRPRELRPGAIPLGAGVVRAVRQLEDRARRLGGVPDVRRRASLVVDDLDLLALGAQAQHRADEVVPGPAEEPGRADDPAVA